MANGTAKFALFDHIEGIDGTPMHQLLNDRLDFVKLADEGGFYGYHLAEHHGSDLCLAPNQEIFLSAVAQVTSQIRLGPLVKILPLHHPLRVLEDICLLDQLSGGRVEYGVGRGPVAIEHFWFNGEWEASYDRFYESLAIIAEGLHTGVAGGKEDRKFFDFPACNVTVTPFQQPNPPFWYPGNPVTAGRYGMSLIWPGPISSAAHEAYLSAWDKHKDDPVRFNTPGSEPRVGTALGIVVHENEATAKDIAARGAIGTARRVNHVHTFDHLALDDEACEAALNPLALSARELARAQAAGPAELAAALAPRTAAAGTPEHVIDFLGTYLAQGHSDYIMISTPAGDQTYAEAKSSLELLITDVKPKFS